MFEDINKVLSESVKENFDSNNLDEDLDSLLDESLAMLGEGKKGKKCEDDEEDCEDDKEESLEEDYESEMTGEMLSEELSILIEGKKELVYDQGVAEANIKSTIESKTPKMTKKGYKLVTSIDKNVRTELAKVKASSSKKFNDVKAKKVAGSVLFLYYASGKVIEGTIMFSKKNEDGSASFRHFKVKIGVKKSLNESSNFVLLEDGTECYVLDSDELLDEDGNVYSEVDTEDNDLLNEDMEVLNEALVNVTVKSASDINKEKSAKAINKFKNNKLKKLEDKGYHIYGTDSNDKNINIKKVVMEKRIRDSLSRIIFNAAVSGAVGAGVGKVLGVKGVASSSAKSSAKSSAINEAINQALTKYSLFKYEGITFISFYTIPVLLLKYQLIFRSYPIFAILVKDNRVIFKKVVVKAKSAGEAKK